MPERYDVVICDPHHALSGQHCGVSHTTVADWQPPDYWITCVTTLAPGRKVPSPE